MGDLLAVGNWEDGFARLETLCGSRWDGRILAQLAIESRPLRRAAVARLVAHAGQEYVADPQMNRSLRRLVDLGLVRSFVSGAFKRYQLTPEGRQRAVLLQQLVQQLPDGQEGEAVAEPAVASPAGHVQPASRAPDPDLAGLVAEWSAALINANAMPFQLSPSEREQVLGRLAAQMYTAATAEPFRPESASVIGAGLIAAGFTAPAALGCTLTVVSVRLVPRLPEPEAARRAALLGEQIAIGFTRSLRDATLDGQEALRRATVEARNGQARRCVPRQWRRSYLVHRC